MDLTLFYAKLPDNLLHTEEMLEKAIKAYSKAVDAEAEAKRAYTNAIKDKMTELSIAGIPKSSIESMAKKHCGQQEMEMEKAKGKKDTIRFWIEAYKERLYNLRYLGKSTEAYKNS